LVAVTFLFPGFLSPVLKIGKPALSILPVPTLLAIAIAFSLLRRYEFQEGTGGRLVRAGPVGLQSLSASVRESYRVTAFNG
jgi:hypothetical protein